MAGTIHQQLVLVKGLEEKCQHKECRRRSHGGLLSKEYFSGSWQCSRWDNSIEGPTYPSFMVNVTKESLRIDGCCNPSWVGEDLRRRGLAEAHDCEDNDTDEGSSFVALLRICAKNK
eukprot:c24248_g15_i1 orf=168-518(+)